MARKHSKAGKKRTQRRYKGGGWGFTGPASIPGAPGTVSNPQVFTGIGDCRAVQPGYDIPYSQYGASMKGLPGMNGGKRTRKGSKGKTRKQRGGRYGFYPEGDVNPSGQAWWAGSYAPVQRIGCEGGSFNPLNPTHTGSSAPPGAASPNYYMTPGKGLMSGGAQLAPATYGVGNVDSMYHYSPTAGYANTASTWKDSVGAPVQIQVPFAARAMNQACLTTGGHPPLTGALQAGGKRNRKGTRKVRRGGAIQLPLIGTLPTTADNFKGIGSTFLNRTGLGSLFGFGAAAPAVVETATVEETPEGEAVNLTVTEEDPIIINNNKGNNKGNNNRGNNNRGNNNMGNRNNMGMGNMNVPPTPPSTPEPPVVSPPAPEVPVAAPPSPMMNNGMSAQAPAAAVNASAVNKNKNNPLGNTSLSYGGRSRSKSRRSKRSALKKKKF